MQFPRLFELAAKSVAKKINEENLPLSFAFDPKSSDLIFRELIFLNPRNVRKLESVHNDFLITQIDLRRVRIYEEDLVNLQKFNLTSLSLGMLDQLSYCFPDDETSIQISKILELALNADSRRGLVHLGVEGKEEFNVGWEEEVSQLLPSLQSINITSKQNFRFPDFCTSFPNLRVLNISKTNLKSLEGIRNLQNLENLVMNFVRIEDHESYQELTELKMLTHLDFSSVEGTATTGTFMILGNLLEARVQMENLKFLDCSGTWVTEIELESFIELHPNLEVVVAIQTGATSSIIPQIRLLNSATIPSLLQALQYSIPSKKHDMTTYCMLLVHVLLQTEILDESDVLACWNCFYWILRFSADDKFKFGAIMCLGHVFRPGYMHMLSSSDLVQLVLFLLDSVKKLVTVPSGHNEMIFATFEGVLETTTPGRLLPDRFLIFMTKEIIAICRADLDTAQEACELLRKVENSMSWQQYVAIGYNDDVTDRMLELAGMLLVVEKLDEYRVLVELIRVHVEWREAHVRAMVKA